MKKELITFDQLAALSFLRFAKLNEIDMTILMKGINNIAEVEMKDDLREYFIMADGTVMLEKSYVEKFNKNVDIELFESISANSVKKYLDNLNMFEFVLRKIKLMGIGCVVKDDLDNNFSFLQKNIMNSLYKERYIMDYCHKDDTYGDYQAIKLTKRGELYLYLIDNKKKIEEFCQLLRENGYNELLIDAFLIVQDLEEKAEDILTLTNFIDFCNEYDVCPNKGKRTGGYKKVRVPNM